jgi:TetR/AcrR family transcriptional regulator
VSAQSPPSDAPPAAKRNAAETKRRLLDAAEREFAAKGYAGARLRDVAQAAGVQQALIHHYFVDKDGLYRAVLDRALAEPAADSWTIVERGLGVEDLVEAFVDLLVRFCESNPNLLAILRMEAASGTSVAIDVMSERTQPVFLAVEALVQNMQKAGELRDDVPAAELMLMVLSMVFMPFHEARLLEALGAKVGPTPSRKRTTIEVVLCGALPAGARKERAKAKGSRGVAS